MKKTIIALISVIALAMMLTGCGEEKNNEITENITRQQEDTTDIEKVDSTEEKSEETKEETKKEIKEDKKDEVQEEKVPEKSQEKQEPEVKKEPEPEPVTEPAAPDVDLNKVNAAIKSAVSASGAMDLGADAISNLYGISPSDISQAAGFVVMEGTFPHEAVMVEAKDSAAADNVERLLKAKHAAFTEQSKGYDAENYELATKCRVERRGNHVSMFLTPNFEAMRNVYSGYVK